MAALHDKIASEVQHLTASTSPLSYENLSILLSSEDGIAQFRKFANNNHVAVVAFTIRIKDELRTLPHLVGTLQSLCMSKAFLDALLCTDPTLLRVIITATTRGSYCEEYRNLSIHMLSNKLPSRVPLPACATDFFLKVASEAAEDPSLERLFRLHNLLSGACASLPQQLPKGTLDKLIEHARPIVPNANTVPEHQPFLVRLAILAHLDPARRVDGSLVTKESSIVSKYFSGKSAEKVLILAVIQACWHSKPTHNPSLESASQSLDAAITVLEKVDPQTRLEWVNTENGHVNTDRVRKTLLDVKHGHPDINLRLWVIMALLNPASDFDVPIPFERLDLEQKGNFHACAIVLRAAPNGGHGISERYLDAFKLRAADYQKWINFWVANEKKSRINCEGELALREEMNSRVTAQADDLTHLRAQERQLIEKENALSNRNVELERQNSSLETTIKLHHDRLGELSAQNVQLGAQLQCAKDEHLALSKKLLEQQHVTAIKENEFDFEKQQLNQEIKRNAQASKVELENNHKQWQIEMNRSIADIREEHTRTLTTSNAHSQEEIAVLRNEHEQEQKKWNSVVESLRLEHKETKASMEKSLEDSGRQLQEANELNTKLEAQLKETKHQHDSTVQDLEKGHRKKITELETTITRARQNHEETVQSFEQQVREREVRAIELTENMENLNLVLRNQEDLIESLKAVRGVGYYAGQREYAAQPSVPPKSGHSSICVPATISRPMQERRDIAVAMMVADQLEGREGRLAIETTSDIPVTTSFSSSVSGPTPKRPRPQRPSHSRYLAAQTREPETTKHSPEKPRVPLSDISSGGGANQSPNKRQLRSPSKLMPVPQIKSPVKPHSRANTTAISRRRSFVPLRPIEKEIVKQHRLTFDPMAFGTPFGFRAVEGGGDTQMDENPST